MTHLHDVAVIGGGPAGSATALLLARAGFDVALIDRRAFPREKACGDCLSAEASHVLDRLGVLDQVLAREPARLRGWRIVADDGRAFTADFAQHGAAHALAISRDRLDAVLLDAARSAGAEVHTETHVRRIAHDDRFTLDAGALKIHSKVLVGADGLRSAVATQFGLVQRAPRLRKTSLTIHVQGLNADPCYGEMHLGPNACVGIAPVDAAAQTWNITLVVDAERHRNALKAGRPEQFVKEMLTQFPRLRGRNAYRQVDGTHVLASGPFDRPTRAVTLPGLALVGDAAGYFDPFTGQGIYQALAGAEMLAQEIAHAFATGATRARFAGYALRQRKLMRDARILQHGIEAVISRPWLARRCIRKLSHAPAAAAALVAATGDLIPARRLLSANVLFSLLQ